MQSIVAVSVNNSGQGSTSTVALVLFGVFALGVVGFLLVKRSRKK